MTSQYDDFGDWASTGGGPGDEVQPIADIKTYVEGIISGLGTLTYDQGDIPASATSRPRGAFEDYNDLVNYLDSGGLTIYDGGGGGVPNPIVYILAVEQPDGHVIYEVWIDDNT
mgnify:CR=1 FL=1